MVTASFGIESKRYGYNMLFYPVKSAKRAEEIQQMMRPNAWVFIRDMKPHTYKGKQIPAIVLPRLIGNPLRFSVSDVEAAGYKRYWQFYANRNTGEITFGNKPSFSVGTPEERRIAREMPIVDLDGFLIGEESGFIKF